MVYNVADIFMRWETLGVFQYLLPFLLIFAIVFGILSSTKFLGDNRAIYIIISLVVGLMTLRWNYLFSAFLSEMFARLGIGLAIILTVLILVGMFIAKDETRYWGWGLGALALLIFGIITYQTFDQFGWLNQGFGSDTIGLIALGLLVAGTVIAVLAGGGPDTTPKGSEATFIRPWAGK